MRVVNSGLVLDVPRSGEKCATCSYWKEGYRSVGGTWHGFEESESGLARGKCLIDSPSGIVMHENWTGVWPSTFEEDWCGWWQNKSVEAPPRQFTGRRAIDLSQGDGG